MTTKHQRLGMIARTLAALHVALAATLVLITTVSLDESSMQSSTPTDGVPTLPSPTPPSSVAAPPLFTPVTGKTVLQWAQVMVQHVQPSDTSYRHTQELVTWAGQHGATIYESRADCSGFLNALFAQTYGFTPAVLQQWLGKMRPVAETYYAAIQHETGFQVIRSIQEIEAGDIIAINYSAPDPGGDTGHIMLVAALPHQRSASEPIVAGTQQWAVPIIDSATSGHGTADTRAISDGLFREGVGQGTVRLYTDATGVLVGYSWSDSTHSVYYDSAERPITIGRMNPAFELGS